MSVRELSEKWRKQQRDRKGMTGEIGVKPRDDSLKAK